MINRQKYCVANFKMNKTIFETDQYIKKFLQLSFYNEKSLDLREKCRIVICPPFTSLNFKNKYSFRTGLYSGAQNINCNKLGAFTGEISAQIVYEAGARYVILGHSERRNHFNETNEEIKKKISLCYKNLLRPILCIGESLDQRKNNKVEKILRTQLSESLKLENCLIIAYEPIWAIGTGETATSKIITETHQMIRKILNDIGFDGQKISILYGGSVNRNNAQELISLEDVDGFLIGSASLDHEHFYDIYKFIEESV